MIGFDEKDGAILAALGRKEYNIRSLARATSMSRTTMAYRLKRMERHKLVEEKKSKGKQKVWQLSTASKQTKRPVHIYYGKDIVRAFALFCEKAPKKTVLYMAEGYQYSKIMNTKTNKRLLHDFDILTHTTYRKRNITIKGFISKNFIETLPKGADSLAMFTVRKKRIIVAKRFRTPDILQEPCLYQFFPRYMMMVNAEKKYAVVVTDTSMARMIYSMISMLYETIDHSHGVDRVDVSQLAEVIGTRY